jgi:hypothetical protein
MIPIYLDERRFVFQKSLVEMTEGELEDHILKALHGGRAEKEGVKPGDLPKKKLKEGAKHEKEHTDDEKTAEQIAADHLVEDPDYYRKIKKLEKGGPPDEPRGSDGKWTAEGGEGEAEKIKWGTSGLTKANQVWLEAKLDELVREAYENYMGLSRFHAKNGIKPPKEPSITASYLVADLRQRNRPDEIDVKDGRLPLMVHNTLEKMRKRGQLLSTFGEGANGKEARLYEPNWDYKPAIKKSIYTKDKGAESKKLDAKRAAPRQPAKASGVSSSGGRKQYRYPEANAARKHKGGGAGGLPAGAPGAEAPVPPAKPVDPGKLASLLHVQVEDLRKLAERLPVNGFITHFKVHYPTLMTLHRVPRNYLEELHEQLVHRTPPVVKALRGHKAYTKRARSGKMSVIAARPGERHMDTAHTLRQKHVLAHTTFKQTPVPKEDWAPGDVIKHPTMGLGVVQGMIPEVSGLLAVSFNSMNEQAAKEDPKRHAAHFKKYGVPLNTVTTVGSAFVTRVGVKAGGRTDTLRASIIKLDKKLTAPKKRKP